MEIFKEFDENSDGTINREELISALSQLDISLSVAEQEIFWLYIDIDGDGQFKYEEFVRMLRRSGLNSVSTENKIVLRIYDAI